MNIKAVARRPCVSTATVSRTINGSAKVPAKTAARVRAATQDLNFSPPALATTSLPRDEIARTAFRALFRTYSQSPFEAFTGEEHLVRSRLIVRKSTGPASS
ncbi:MAG TPA: LacI family DNA-binding transcriptional regulator [Acidobacteriaceae bacterium]|nr:LacI family DNA-binding transcriptional regulator [Acidobacteriaceae bacterium]